MWGEGVPCSCLLSTSGQRVPQPASGHLGSRPVGPRLLPTLQLKHQGHLQSDFSAAAAHMWLYRLPAFKTRCERPRVVGPKPHPAPWLPGGRLSSISWLEKEHRGRAGRAWGPALCACAAQSRLHTAGRGRTVG